MSQLTKSRAWHMFVAFVGWLLSPVTWWNDAFVNIPIAYVLASFIAWVWPKAFLVAFIAAYWATNLLGSWMLLWGGRELVKSVVKAAAKPPRPWLMTTLTILYCVVMSWLIAKDIVKPLPPP